jgi:tRNA-dihydrouridine synthase A
MDWTDRHCRFFLRLLSKNALLYTEMVTTGALLNGDHERFLRHNEAEHPLALQLGGSVPLDLAACAHGPGPRVRRGEPERRLPE